MVPVPNSTTLPWAQPEAELERSPCLVGIVPIVYYSILLGLGLPGEGAGGLERKILRIEGSYLLLPSLRPDPSARLCCLAPGQVLPPRGQMVFALLGLAHGRD